MNLLSENNESAIDFTSLEELLKYVSMLGLAMLCGYPACCLMFSARKWNSYSKYTRGLFSAAVGSGYAVIVWVIIVYIGLTVPEYSNVIKGNEMILAIALLCLIAMVEVVLLAISFYVRRFLARRRKS